MNNYSVNILENTDNIDEDKICNKNKDEITDDDIDNLLAEMNIGPETALFW